MRWDGKVWSDPRDKVAPDRREVPREPWAGCLGSTSSLRGTSACQRDITFTFSSSSLFFPFTFLFTDRMVRLKQQTGKNFSLSAKAYFQFLWSLPEKQGGFINAFLLCFMQNARRLTPCLGIVIFQRKWIQIEFFSISKQIWFNLKCKYIETSCNMYLKGNLGKIFKKQKLFRKFWLFNLRPIFLKSLKDILKTLMFDQQPRSVRDIW